MQQDEAASAPTTLPAAIRVCPARWVVLLSDLIVSDLIVMTPTVHPVVATGSRTPDHGSDHSCASRRSSDRPAVATERRQHRDHPLLRADQDAARSPAHGKRPPRL